MITFFSNSVQLLAQNPFSVCKIGLGTYCIYQGAQLTNSRNKPIWQTAAGVGLIALGLFSVVSAISEFGSYSFESKEPALNWDPKELELAKRKIELVHSRIEPSDGSQIKAIISKLQSCPKGNELWKEINTKQEITVLFDTPINVPSHSYWEPKTGTIVIDRSLQPSDQKLQWLLYQSCSAKQDLSGNFLKNMEQKAMAGDLDRMQYLKKIASYQFKAIQDHYRIANECIKQNGWDKRINPYKSWKDFNEWWKNYASNSVYESSRNATLEIWNKKFKPFFCLKYPLHMDCK